MRPWGRTHTTSQNSDLQVWCRVTDRMSGKGLESQESRSVRTRAGLSMTNGWELIKRGQKGPGSQRYPSFNALSPFGGSEGSPECGQTPPSLLNSLSLSISLSISKTALLYPSLCAELCTCSVLLPLRVSSPLPASFPFTAHTQFSGMWPLISMTHIFKGL